MLEVADKLDPNRLLYDAPTLTGRAIQAALAIAQAWTALQIGSGRRIEIAAADITIGLMRRSILPLSRERAAISKVSSRCAPEYGNASAAGWLQR